VRRASFALLVAAAAAATGCGGDSDREKVGHFVTAANEVQQRSAPAFDRANRAYANFSKGDLRARRAQRELAAAERTMRQTRDDIAALHAPSKAAELKRRLVALYTKDAALAHESTLLASFVPASATAMKPLASVGGRLTSSLRAADSPEQQIAALRRYARGVARVVKRLEPLQPPPLLIDRHHGQVEHLRRVRSLALRMVGALEAEDSEGVARLLLRFRKLNGQTSATALPPGALAAYNRRYLGVRRALQSVERERSRLERSLG
jgi:hypothetical protein